MSIDTDLIDRFTYSPGFTMTVQGYEPEVGYAVGMYPEATKILDPKSMSPAALRAEIRLWVVRNRDLLALAGHFIGGWQENETDLMWLDIVQVFGVDEEEAAVAAGKAANQKCIWSLHGSFEIDTEGTGEAL